MSPCRANSRNANTRNENTTLALPDQEVSNAKFKSDIQMLAQSVANQNNQHIQDHVNGNDGSIAARVCDIVGIDLPEYLTSQTSEDPQNFLDEIKKIF
ncbi:hypothetical protein EJD97_008118 [Solanum chilense]|uniref:Gag-pol polyprotein n=1 Tax=Solanum chilense TaxID=4083 RepID=A0A6N2AHF9_SOLCI|nr:hypothetical protein EJD97_008118 [Solanum chilense]